MEATAEVSKTFDEKIGKYCDVTLMSLAYAGTGNVLKVFDIRVKCTGGPLTFVGVSSRSINSETAFLGP